MRDNGLGIAPAALAGQGSLGIMGMRERAHQAGGHPDLSGSPGQGTAVRLQLPIRLRWIRTDGRETLSRSCPFVLPNPKWYPALIANGSCRELCVIYPGMCPGHQTACANMVLWVSRYRPLSRQRVSSSTHRRLGTLEDVADAALILASPRGRLDHRCHPGRGPRRRAGHLDP